jgi:hypothetical protein
MPHFRTLSVSLVMLTAVAHFSCQRSSDNALPEHALSPDLIESPATGAAHPGERKSPVIAFDSDRHDFGKITAGEKVSYSFHFRNTGDADLLIRHAQASCGCTVPEWPKEPLPPGKDGNITVTFNSEGKNGQISKTITIISNTIPNSTILTITGDVEN